MTTGALESLRRYVLNSRQYLENALLFLQKGEAGKAGELLWGSVAEALQAVAASRGVRLANHRSLRYFAGAIAKELGDAALAQGFRDADRLHSNFYEVELEPADVAGVLEPIRTTVGKLFALIPEEALREKLKPDSNG